MFGTYQRLNVRTFASDIEVIRAAREKITKAGQRDPKQRDARKKFYRIMLDYHHRAQELVS